MCNLRVFKDVSGFLSPYYNFIQPSSDDLLMIDKTMHRCWEYEVCPKQILRIENKDLQRRKVRVAVREDGDIVRKAELRDHCPRDVERCFGMGYLLGTSCSDAIQTDEETCVVDLFVLPLVWVVFRQHTSMTLQMIERSQLSTQLHRHRWHSWLLLLPSYQK